MGLRILITHPFLYEINGATLVTLELADYLQSRGDKVTVYTNTFHDPIRAVFENRGIHVDVFRNHPHYRLQDFDLVWINSQTFPVSLLEELGGSAKLVHAPKFIFMHMSAHAECADEMPYIYGFEEALSSLSLFVSEEALGVNRKFYEQLPPTALYQNPAPLEYCFADELSSLAHSSRKRAASSAASVTAPTAPSASKPLQKLLVVANYPCDELREIKPLLQGQGIAVDYLGLCGDKYELLTAQTLARYDAVISIGKTVQYCLVAGMPIYVYGQFGGPGWLTDRNFAKAESRNFSGRGFRDKTPEEIVDDLLSGHAAARKYAAKRRTKFQAKFSIDQVIPRIFDQALKTDHPLASFSPARIAAMTSLLRLVAIDFERWYDCSQLSANLRAQNTENATLRRDNTRLREIVASKSVQMWLKLNRAKTKIFPKK